MKRSILRVFLWYVAVMAVLGIGASAAGYLRPEAVAAAMARIRVSGLMWLAGINGVILLTATGRWWRILSAFGRRIAAGRLAVYRLAAGAVSYITPGTQFGGEPLQAFLLVRREGVPADIAAASVFLERAMELALNLILVGGGLLWMVRQPSPGVAGGLSFDAFGPGRAGRVLTAVSGGAALLFLAWRRCRPAGESSPSRLPRIFQRIRQLIQQTRGRVGQLFREHPGALVSALGFGLIHWGFVFGEFFILYGCIGEWLSAPQVLVVLTAARIGLWAPVPGGMGALEAGQLMAARLLGIPSEAAVGVCLLIRLRDVVVCSAGLFLTGRYVSQTIKGNGNGCMEKGI